MSAARRLALRTYGHRAADDQVCAQSLRFRTLLAAEIANGATLGEAGAGFYCLETVTFTGV